MLKKLAVGSVATVFGILLSGLFLFGAVLVATWVSKDGRCDEIDRIIEEGGTVFFSPGHFDCRDLLTRALEPFM